MQTQRKELNFKLQNTFDSIAVHLKCSSISILTDSLHYKFIGCQKTAISIEYLAPNFPKKKKGTAKMPSLYIYVIIHKIYCQ